MRKLEALLVAAALAVSFLLYVNQGQSTSVSTAKQIVAVGLLVVLLAHVLIESPRWQLTPVYAVSTVAIAMAGFGIAVSGWPSHLIFWTGLVALAGGLVLGIGLPILSTPHLSGQYFVGTSTFHLTQTERPEIHSDRTDNNRQLMMQVWYPAAESLHPIADYLPDLALGVGALARAFKMPRFGLNHFDLIRPNARIDAPMAVRRPAFPVLLFSHGRSGTRVQNSFQIEELVSHGYVVAAVDHPFAAGYTVYPSGEVIDYAPHIFGDDSPEAARVVTDEWLLDFACVLDTLEDFNETPGGQFFERLALRRVGVFGHSTGGGAAFDFCAQDDRCGPVLGYDPWLVPTSDETIRSGLDQPIMVLKQDVPLGRISDARLEQLLANTEATRYLYEIEGAKHLDFNDYKLLVPALEWFGVTGSVDGEQLREILNELTRAFFDAHLRGYPLAPVLRDPGAFPQAHLRTL